MQKATLLTEMLNDVKPGEIIGRGDIFEVSQEMQLTRTISTFIQHYANSSLILGTGIVEDLQGSKT